MNFLKDLWQSSAQDEQAERTMTTRKSKKEAQREQMRRNLIETAESLFAEHGIAAVSLR